MSNFSIDKPKNILIIRLSSLGDIIQCLPVAYNIKKTYPFCRITWLVREEYHELPEIDECVDELITIKNAAGNNIFGRIKEICKAIALIRRNKFDVVLDLHCALITNIISIFSNSPLKLGIDKRNELGLKILKYHPLPKDKKVHRINIYLSILNLLGIDNYEIKYSFKIPTENKKNVLNLLKNNYTLQNTVIALHPGTAQEIKQWGIEKFAKLSSILTTKYGSKIIVIYGPKEKHFEKNNIIKLFDSKENFIVCANVKELAALLERCDLLIGNDSGPIHLAAALGIHTVSIFGPSNHLISSPFGDNNRIVRKDVSCSPCYGVFSVQFKCKNRGQKCLKLLNVEDILKETEPILKGIISAKHAR